MQGHTWRDHHCNANIRPQLIVSEAPIRPDCILQSGRFRCTLCQFSAELFSNPSTPNTHTHNHAVPQASRDISSPASK